MNAAVFSGVPHFFEPRVEGAPPPFVAFDFLRNAEEQRKKRLQIFPQSISYPPSSKVLLDPLPASFFLQNTAEQRKEKVSPPPSPALVYFAAPAAEFLKDDHDRRKMKAELGRIEDIFRDIYPNAPKDRRFDEKPDEVLEFLQFWHRNFSRELKSTPNPEAVIEKFIGYLGPILRDYPFHRAVRFMRWWLQDLIAAHPPGPLDPLQGFRVKLAKRSRLQEDSRARFSGALAYQTSYLQASVCGNLQAVIQTIQREQKAQFVILQQAEERFEGERRILAGELNQVERRVERLEQLQEQLDVQLPRLARIVEQAKKDHLELKQSIHEVREANRRKNGRGFWSSLAIAVGNVLGNCALGYAQQAIGGALR